MENIQAKVSHHQRLSEERCLYLTDNTEAPTQGWLDFSCHLETFLFSFCSLFLLQLQLQNLHFLPWDSSTCSESFIFTLSNLEDTNDKWDLSSNGPQSFFYFFLYFKLRASLDKRVTQNFGNGKSIVIPRKGRLVTKIIPKKCCCKLHHRRMGIRFLDPIAVSTLQQMPLPGFFWQLWISHLQKVI